MVEILESDNLAVKFQDLVHMIFKMLFLNMAVKINQNMDSVQEYKWKTIVIFQDQDNMNQKNKYIQKSVE